LLPKRVTRIEARRAIHLTQIVNHILVADRSVDDVELERERRTGRSGALTFHELGAFAPDF